MNTINHTADLPGRRFRRSLGMVGIAATLALGMVACGEKDDEFRPAAQVPSDEAAAKQAYLDFRVEALARDSMLRRVAAATGSDKHLELLADSVASQVAVSSGTEGSDKHLEYLADDVAAETSVHQSGGLLVDDIAE